jgi:hypothetical protein
MAVHASQNIMRFVPAKKTNIRIISAQKQNWYLKNFLHHFFMPWKMEKTKIAAKLTPMSRYFRKDQLTNITIFSRNLGFGENYHKNSAVWFKRIIRNMDMHSFPNRDRNAITIHNTLVRYFPTLDPHFYDFRYAGQGYPFDNFQKSVILAGTPIHVYQVSRSGDWVFVQSPAVFGWIRAENIAYVEKNFMQRWRHATYVATIGKKVPVHDITGVYRLHAYMGAIFPMEAEHEHSYTILIPTANLQQQAVIVKAEVTKKVMQKMPLIATPANFAKLIKQLLGEPYGWGGLNFYTDCSSALKSIYAPFGIWLPRNSGAQAKVGKNINLSHLSSTGRQNYILRYGVPFVTLIHVPGHIMLYLGAEKGKVMTFQNVWAFQTWARRNGGYCEGRAIVGKAVLLPLELQYDMGITPQIAVNELDVSFL